MTDVADNAARMDRMYRLQRFVYDPTRRWYLFGRDRLIDELDPPENGRVLEIACGTGRNLVHIARRHPRVRLYGIDISEEMLKSALANRCRAGLEGRMKLAAGDAAEFDPAAVFDTARFDRIVFSYGLSMIPSWREAIDHCLGLLAPGGSLHVVDFGNMSGLPAPARAALHWWLACFHVTPRPRIAEHLACRARALGARQEECRILGQYAFLATLKMPTEPIDQPMDAVEAAGHELLL